MFSRFFIDRPIFAAVLSLFVVIAGLAATRNLPIAQYPEIAPPVVTVTAIYPGASAEVVEQTVAAPLENAINGVEHMLYMGSTSTSNGVVTIQVTFDIGANVDQAAQQVNNRVKQAEARLPQEVRRQGVTVEKGSSAFLQVLAFFSPDDSRSDLEISNFVTLNVLDSIKRTPGTTSVQIFGAKDYAMRIWVKPDRLTQLKLTTADLIREGHRTSRTPSSPPARSASRRPAGAQETGLHASPRKGRLSEPHAVREHHPARRGQRTARLLRLKRRGADRARRASDNDFIGRINGKPATLVGIFLQPGANALEVAATTSRRRSPPDLAERFPSGLDLHHPLRHHALRRGVDPRR